MCIILLWRQQSNELFGKFKFVLAANRDEYFYRPARPARFWENEEQILAGEDITEGVEGGIWIGVKKNGAIGALTNLRNFDNPSLNLRSGRGQLIREYLLGNKSPSDYLSSLPPATYRPFNLIVGKLDGEMHYLESTHEAKVSSLDKGFICLTNHILDQPTLKKEHARKIFADALHRTDDLQSLEKNMLEVLQDTKINHPDDNVPEELAHLSSVFVPLMESEYGTRIHTIISVDENNHVTFIEKTKVGLNDPPDRWLRNEFSFDLK